MKKIIPLLAIAFIITATSCKRNLCEGVVCNNLGECKDGVCQCPAAWTGTTCDVHTNPCDTTICKNGGTCVTGNCNCPGHTSGQHCEIQETPAHMSIPKLAIEKFSITDATGHLWDSTDFADIYPVIKLNGNVIYNGTPYKKDNANYVTWYPFVLGGDSIIIPSANLTNPNYRMEIWDYDGGGSADTYMNGFNFTPYTDSTGFRGSIELTDTTAYNKNFIMYVYFEYSW